MGCSFRKLNPFLLFFKASLRNIFLIFLSLAIGLAVCEGLLRLFNVGSYSLADRVLFFTFPAWVVGNKGDVRYQPNTEIRSLAVYGDVVDYDVIQKTNNLGFVDGVDYYRPEPSVHRIVFVGDSLTAGSGGFPWIEQLRKKIGLDDYVALYNLGVGGTGVAHFIRRLENFWFDIGFDEVNVMVISNDFYRVSWKPIVDGRYLWFCPETESLTLCTKKRKPIVHQIEAGTSKNMVIEKALEIYRKNRGPGEKIPAFYKRTHLYNLGCDVYSQINQSPSVLEVCPHLKVVQHIPYTKDSRYFNAIEAIRALRYRYPSVRFRVIHIPEKAETVFGHYGVDIQSELAYSGIQYLPLLNLCSWDRSMYHKHDGHPNKQGYSNLAECLDQILSLRDKSH